MASPSRRHRRREHRRRQRHRASEAAARRDGNAAFEDIPPELHADIHRRLAFRDRLALAAVFGASGRMLRPEAPWLILPGVVAPAPKEKKPTANTTRARYRDFSSDSNEQDEDEEEYEPMPEPPEEEAAAPVASEEKSTVVSMAECGSKSGYQAPVRTTSELALSDRVIIGSSDGWVVTADDRGALRMANPVTCAQADLPAITTIPFLHATGGGNWFCLDVAPFVRLRFGAAGPPENDKDWGPHPPRTSTLTAAQMRQRFYRKVVLSPSPRPGRYAAMLIPDRHIGAPAFADGAAWRMAPSRAGVEDAIYHGGRFVSVSYAGDVEAWRRDAATGEYAGEAVAPRLACDDKNLRRKYLAAAPDGRLVAVLKRAREVEVEGQYGRSTKTARVSFEVRVLDAAAGRWEPAGDDIVGAAALFVGVNATVCVAASEHRAVAEEEGGCRGIQAGCVYFTDDEVGDACLRHAQGANTVRVGYGETDETELRAIGVYSLKEGRVTERIADTKSDYNSKQLRWPPAAWFTPSFL